MILTCPNCATRYFLHDVLVGRAGRTVKCTSCGSTWRAEAEEDDPLSLTEPSPDPDGDPQADGGGPDGLSALPADRLSQAFRAKAQEQRKVREAAATGAIWAGLASGLVLVIALAAVFRVDVVRMWPKTASAYASVGLPVNTTGLIIEQVKAAPGSDGGHPAVMVSGVMRNIADRTVNAPLLRVSLLGKDGRAVARRLANASGSQIRPGETRPFTISMTDPPKTASDVEVTFALDVMPPPASSPAAPALKLRGPAATPSAPAAPAPPSQSAPPSQAASAAPDAKPLPSTSPYALPTIKSTTG
jgi:predicted Zn finger-like uncharacterized protein